MNSAPLRPCRSPGCSALVPSGWCAQHASPRSAFGAQRRAGDRLRGTAAARGYDARWRAESRAFLARFPLCAGVLVPTADWTPELAQAFAELREGARERGELLILEDRGTAPLGLEAQRRSCLRFLERHPIYEVRPHDAGRPATVVDHIVPHKGDSALFWAVWNWQPLTKRAHDRKTAAEDRGSWSPPAPPEHSYR